MVLIQRLSARLTDMLALTWATSIGYLSLNPLEELPVLQVSDKLGHFAAYALLALLGTLARRSHLTQVSTLLLILCYSGLIEIVQPYVNRFMELQDFTANALGTLCGGLIGFALSTVSKAEREPG